MRKYIFALILGFGIVLHGQTVYAKAVDKNILTNQELVGTITPEQLEKYIANGGDVNARDNKYGVTVLMAVAMAGQNPEIIDALLKHGANIEARDKDGVSALMYAASFNQNPEVIETLIKHGANIEARNNNGWTALICAAGFNQNPKVIETLLKHGANIEARDKDGVTALMVAAANNENPEIIETLLKHGANIRDGNQLLELLEGNKNIERNQDFWDLRDRIYDKINR